jgi:hypothetical protein
MQSMDPLGAWWRDTLFQWGELTRRLAFWAPTVPAPRWLAPAVALGALLALALAAGIAITALAALIAALLVAHLLLTQVFGVSFDTRLPG